MSADIHQEEFLDGLLAIQLKPGEVVYASGAVANNHLDLGYAETIPTHRPRIVNELVRLLSGLDICPGFIAPVPSGAVGWAEEVSKHLPVTPELILVEKRDKRVFEPTKRTLRQAEWLQGMNGVVIDDVTSDGGTSEALAECLEGQIGLKVNLIISILFRGKDYAPSRFERAAVYRRYVPHHLNWQIYQDMGKIVEL